MQEFSGFQYIKIDIANKFGLDKEDWDVRLQWFEDNKHNLRNMVNEADSPAQFYSAVASYEKVVQGLPTGSPIDLDATASGAQVLCALTGDYEGGKLCNIVNTGKREDLYTYIHNYMVDEYNIPSTITRASAKLAIMASFYSSIKEPLKVFTQKHIDHYNQTMTKLMRGAWRLNTLFMQLWRDDVDAYRWTLPDLYVAGFKVMVEAVETFSVNNVEYTSTYLEQGSAPEGRALSANIVHSIDAYMVREITARAMIPRSVIAKVKKILKNPRLQELTYEEDARKNELVSNIAEYYKKTGILSARVLEYVEAYNIHMLDKKALKNLLNTIPEKAFNVLCVHDSYKVLPNYGNDLRKLYREVLAEIADSTLLASILKEAVDFDGNIKKITNDLGKHIRESEYALS